MVEQGARSIVLMGRSGEPLPENRPAFRELLRSPAKVTIVPGDVSLEEDVTRVLTHIRANLPPLRGLFHTAMVLEDRALVDLDADCVRKVLAPKIAGAWNLHRLAADESLDWFVLFSSATSVVGNPRQGNYAAANAFLDALAHYRRSLGLPALSVSWGMLSRTGYLTRQPDAERHLRRFGLGSISPEEAFAALGPLLRNRATHAIAGRTDWERWMATHPSAYLKQFSLQASKVRGSKEANPSQEPQSLLASLTGMPTAERRQAIEEYLVLKVAQVLATSPSKVDPESPLTAIGLDSLIAVELQSVMKLDFGFQVATARLLQGISIRQLTDRILERICPGPEVQPEVLPSPEHDKGDILPLGFEQRRLWFLQQLDLDSPAYNVPLSVRFSGTLNASALKSTLNEIACRHDALRATFCTRDGEPVQRIAKKIEIPLPTVDLSPLPEFRRDAEVRRIVLEEGQTKFDLNRGPLVRAMLLRLSDYEHILFLVFHHLIIDAWSLAVINRESAILYDAFSRDERPILPEPSVRYADFIGQPAEPGIRLRRLAPPVLAAATFWRSGAGLADRSAAAPAAHPPWRTSRFRGPQRHHGINGAVGAKRKGDVVHDTARCVPGPAAPIFRAARFLCGYAGCQPLPRGRSGSRGLFCQYACHARSIQG